MIPEKPTPAPYTFDKIPAYFTERAQWVCWKYEWKVNQAGAGKWTKVPYQYTGSAASSTDPTTWTSFAVVKLVAHVFDGIGYMVAVGEDIVMFDFDRVIGHDGTLNPLAAEMIKSLDTYTEQTPSGVGLHAYAFGQKPGESCKTIIAKGTEHAFVFEMYEHSRYLTFTGWHVEGTPETVERRDAEIAAVYHRAFPAPEPKPRELTGSRGAAPELSDEEVLRRRREDGGHEKFIARYDRGEYLIGPDGQPDLSGTDYSLIGMLRFYTQDADQIERLMRRSQLVRDKWDEPRPGGTYLTFSIANALEGDFETYPGPATAALDETGTPAPSRPRFTEDEDEVLFYDPTRSDEKEIIEYHWQDFTAKGSLNTVLGAKKDLKSWLQALLAVSAAAPVPVLPGLPGGNERVLILTGPRENSLRETRRRIKAIRRQFSLKPGGAGRIKVRAYTTAMLRLDHEEGDFQELLACISDYQPTTIMLDSTAAVWGGKNENDTAEVRTWFEKRVGPMTAAAPGVTVYVIAHTGHPARVGQKTFQPTHQRGASGWEDATDTSILVKKADAPEGSPEGTVAAELSLAFTRFGEPTARRLLFIVQGGPRSGLPIEVRLTELEPDRPGVDKADASPSALSKALEAAEQILAATPEGLFASDLRGRLVKAGLVERTAAGEVIQVLTGTDGHPWPAGPHQGQAVSVVMLDRRKHPKTGKQQEFLRGLGVGLTR